MLSIPNVLYKLTLPSYKTNILKSKYSFPHSILLTICLRQVYLYYYQLVDLTNMSKETREEVLANILFIVVVIGFIILIAIF